MPLWGGSGMSMVCASIPKGHSQAPQNPEAVLWPGLIAKWLSPSCHHGLLSGTLPLPSHGPCVQALKVTATHLPRDRDRGRHS